MAQYDAMPCHAMPSVNKYDRGRIVLLPKHGRKHAMENLLEK